MAMDEKTNSRHVGEGSPADADFQVAEPRGHLDHSENDVPVIGDDAPANGTPGTAGDASAGASAAGHSEDEDQDRPDGRRELPRSDSDDGPPSSGGDPGEEGHGSGRSFLLGLAWWP